MTECVCHPCRKDATVTIKQKYKDGSVEEFKMCRDCANRWLKLRPISSWKVVRKS